MVSATDLCTEAADARQGVKSERPWNVQALTNGGRQDIAPTE